MKSKYPWIRSALFAGALALIAGVMLMQNPAAWRRAWHDQVVSEVPLGSPIGNFDKAKFVPGTALWSSAGSMVDGTGIGPGGVRDEKTAQIAYVALTPIDLTGFLQMTVEAQPLIKNGKIAEYTMTSHWAYTLPWGDQSQYPIYFSLYGKEPETDPKSCGRE